MERKSHAGRDDPDPPWCPAARALCQWQQCGGPWVLKPVEGKRKRKRKRKAAESFCRRLLVPSLSGGWKTNHEGRTISSGTRPPKSVKSNLVLHVLGDDEVNTAGLRDKHSLRLLRANF